MGQTRKMRCLILLAATCQIGPAQLALAAPTEQMDLDQACYTVFVIDGIKISTTSGQIKSPETIADYIEEESYIRKQQFFFGRISVRYPKIAYSDFSAKSDSFIKNGNYKKISDICEKVYDDANFSFAGLK